MPGINEQRISEALTILRKALRAFVEERMRSEYKDRWMEKARLSLNDFRSSRAGNLNLDVQALIRIATDRQHQALYNSFFPILRNFLHELRDVRNRHAHMERFQDRDVERALDTLERLLQAIKSPEALMVTAMRRPSEPPRTSGAPADTSHRIESPQLGADAQGMQRPIRLFRFLAESANRGKPIGIGYDDFIAFLHWKGSFREVAGREFLPSDIRVVIEVVWSIAEANGRIEVTSGGRSILSGMDTFIWANSRPYDRSERAWRNPKCTLPYSRADWKAVFPDGQRRLIEPRELAALS